MKSQNQLQEFMISFLNFIQASRQTNSGNLCSSRRFRYRKRFVELNQFKFDKPEMPDMALRTDAAITIGWNTSGCTYLSRTVGYTSVTHLMYLLLHFIQRIVSDGEQRVRGVNKIISTYFASSHDSQRYFKQFKV